MALPLPLGMQELQQLNTIMTLPLGMQELQQLNTIMTYHDQHVPSRPQYTVRADFQLSK
jgi:hypothetical protein